MNKKIYAKGEAKFNKKTNDIEGAIASTGSLDRDNEVLAPEGWDLKNFEKNAPLLWSHNAWSLPIGKVTNIATDTEGKLIFNAKFAEAENPFAKKVAKLFRGGFIKGVSVGFIPKEREENVITKMELLEISLVNIPANAEAVASRAYKSFVKDLKTKKPKKKQKKPKKSVKEKNIITQKQRLQLRNAIELINELAPAFKTKKRKTKKSPGRKKVVQRDKREARILKALRIVDRAVEYAILEIKSKKNAYKKEEKDS